MGFSLLKFPENCIYNVEKIFGARPHARPPGSAGGSHIQVKVEELRCHFTTPANQDLGGLRGVTTVCTTGWGLRGGVKGVEVSEQLPGAAPD